MNRTTVSLPDDLARLVQHEAQRLGVTVSALVRDVLRHHLGVAPTSPPRLPFVGLGRSDGSEGVARNVDEILAREWPRAIDDRDR